MNKKLRNWLLLPVSVFLLSGCNGGGGGTSVEPKCTTLTDVNALLPTPVTDSFKFAQANDLEGKRFAGNEGEQYDHIGLVTLRSCTDGDTANFIQDDYRDEDRNYITIKLRFLGVNTPESTAKVEPWGKKASLFTKKVLTDAQADADANHTKNICLINSVGPFEERDSSGNRWMGFIWYRPTHTADWRLLNLEIVEQAYSRNQLFTDDPSGFCDYRTKFEAVESKYVECKYRVFGTPDPDFDYTEKTYEYSLWKIVNDYDNIGINDETGGSGVQLIVTALVVAIQGDNMFLRDIVHDAEQEDDKLQGLYAYSGFNSSVCSLLQNASTALGMDGTGVGVVARFYCRATMYGGNVQLSDVKSSTTGKKGFKVLDEDNFSKYADELKWSKEYQDKGSEFSYSDLNVTPSIRRLEPTSISSSDDIGEYQYDVCETEVEIRSVTPQDTDDEGHSETGSGYWYKPTKDSKSYTVYALINGKDGRKIYTNIRIDNSMYPYLDPSVFGTSVNTDLDSENSPVGKTFHVTGYVAKYFDKYQIQLPNNYPAYNYFYKV